MKAPLLPENETQRVSVLDQLGIIYSPSEERFDRITRLAKRIFKVPIVLVSMVTANTQWFKSSQGLLAGETAREISFCGHAILGEDTFIIPDTHKDPDFSDNPLVTGEPHIRFYAGHPITVNSVKIGTFCIIDRKPRRFSQADYDTLKSLAMWVENEVKLSLYTASQKELMVKVGSLQRKTLLDSITGCWNRRGFDKLLENELDRSAREKLPLSMLLIEISGASLDISESTREARDTILRETAQEIRGVFRGHDIIGRLDGLRFLVFLGNCEKDVCEVLVQRVLRNLTIRRIKLGQVNIKLDACVGFTCSQSTDTRTAETLLQIIEQALQIAQGKKGTGNMHYLAAQDAGN